MNQLNPQDVQRWFQSQLKSSVVYMFHVDVSLSQVEVCKVCPFLFSDALHSLEEQSKQRVIATKHNQNLMIL